MMHHLSTSPQLNKHVVASDQEMVGLQIDFAKAFDRIRWDFIVVVLKKLGFGIRFCRLIYILAQDNAFDMEINGSISTPFSIERCVSGMSIESSFLCISFDTNVLYVGS
ncbi:hypothetical protein KP509_10G083600 [Ceratopteris richardii]|uniref:Reverse transcriptase domain-containing protein n=1 Tax=Ceratopteris richardii TaxID=49495 RepID=A0A8T2TX00_CERRI|nr:hypothetical protein KP509_10G083600 [Ceratopteris richardii]